MIAWDQVLTGTVANFAGGATIAALFFTVDRFREARSARRRVFEVNAIVQNELMRHITTAEAGAGVQAEALADLPPLDSAVLRLAAMLGYVQATRGNDRAFHQLYRYIDFVNALNGDLDTLRSYYGPGITVTFGPDENDLRALAGIRVADGIQRVLESARVLIPMFPSG